MIGNNHTPSGLPQLGSPRPPRQENSKEEKQTAGAGSATPPTAPALGPSPLYLIMNKPKGYVCSAVSDSHKTVYQLLPAQMQILVKGAKRGHRLHTVGRLDADTTGLLLFTTDGKFSHYLTSPDSNIEKTYEVTLKYKVSQDQQQLYINKAASGLILPAEKKSPAEKCSPENIVFIEENRCFITISEGKFHQVRRTFLALNNEVTELKRISIGTLKLPEDLEEGDFREMIDLWHQDWKGGGAGA